MKKILIVLGILTLICINCAFADNERVQVIDTAESAVALTDGALYGFDDYFSNAYNYLITNNYINQGDKYILFPSKVEHVYDGVYNQIHITFQLMVSSSSNYSDEFVVISHNSVAPSQFPGHYDFWVGYTGDWQDITATTITYIYNYENLQQVGSPSINNNTSFVDSYWGMRWQTNFSFNSGNTIYLLVSDYANIAQFGGLYFSVYSSQDLLKTYLQYYAGSFQSGLWNDYYIINPNYVINVYRNDSSNISNINTEVYVTSNSIIFNNDVSNNETMDLNINSIWGTLKSYVYNLIAGLTSVASLFQVVFSWLPNEITSIIYIGLILCFVLLLIKAFRGG